MGQIKNYDMCRSSGSGYVKAGIVNYLCRPSMTIPDLTEILMTRYSDGLPSKDVIVMVGTQDLTDNVTEILRGGNFGERLNREIDRLFDQLKRYPIRRLLVILIPPIPRYDTKPNFYSLRQATNDYLQNKLTQWQQLVAPMTRISILNLTEAFEVSIPTLGEGIKIPVLHYFEQELGNFHSSVDLINFSELGVKVIWTAIRERLIGEEFFG